MSTPVSDKINKRPRKAVQSGEPVSVAESGAAPSKKTRAPKSKKPEEAAHETSQEPVSEEKGDVKDPSDKAQEGASEDPKKKKRFFQVVSIRRGHADGEEIAFDPEKKWLGNSPSGAARKAAYRIYRDVFGDTDDSVEAIMGVREYVKPPRSKKAEEPQAKERKVYRYTVTRVAASGREPAVFGKDQEGGKPTTLVPFKYDMVVHKYPPKSDKAEDQEEARASA